MSDDEPINPFAAPEEEQKQHYRPSKDHSVFDEPHLLNEEFVQTQPMSVEDLKPLDLEPTRLNESVFDEPAFSGTLPEDAVSYQTWLLRAIGRTSIRKSWTVVLSAGLLGGFLTAAVCVASPARFLMLTPLHACLVVCGIQTFKVLPLILLVEFRPYLFKSSRQIWFSTVLAGLAYTITRLGYAYVTSSFLATGWESVLDLLLQVLTSLCAGAGLAHVWRECIREKQSPRISDVAWWLSVAIGVHLGYFWVFG